MSIDASLYIPYSQCSLCVNAAAILEKANCSDRRMPHSCAAFKCFHRMTSETRSRGITFHKFPKNEVMRKRWETALRREGFSASRSSKLCSEHFRPEDFDRTGQTIRIRNGAVPSVFCFPAHIQRPVATRTSRTSKKAKESLSVDRPQLVQETKPLHVPTVPVATRTSRTSKKAVESLSVDRPQLVQETKPLPVPNVDHSYALPSSPEDLKARLSEALARVESLEREKRNAKDRERRAKNTVFELLEDIGEIYKTAKRQTGRRFVESETV